MDPTRQTFTTYDGRRISGDRLSLNGPSGAPLHGTPVSLRGEDNEPEDDDEGDGRPRGVALLERLADKLDAVRHVLRVADKLDAERQPTAETVPLQRQTLAASPPRRAATAAEIDTRVRAAMKEHGCTYADALGRLFDGPPVAPARDEAFRSVGTIRRGAR